MKTTKLFLNFLILLSVSAFPCIKNTISPRNIILFNDTIASNNKNSISILKENLISLEGLKVGDLAPNINITDYISNTPKDINFKNKFILLEFWATWCGPCLEEVPVLNKFQDKFKNKKDFVFISITNEKPDKVLRTIKRIPFNSIVVSDQSGTTFKSFIEDKDGSYSIPSTFLIDNKGIIKWIGSPSELNDLVLNKFISNKELNGTDNSSSNSPPGPIFIKPTEEKITDIAYKTIYNSATINNFTLLMGSKNEFNMNFNELKKEGLYFDLNKNIISILSNLSNVLESQIQISEDLKENNYSLFYKNKNFNGENELKKDIKAKLLKSINLSETVIHKKTDIYELKVKNKSKLEEITNEIEIKNGYNATHFLFSNVEIDAVIKSISTYFKIIIKDKTNLNGKYDFILKNISQDEMIKDLEIYGLYLNKVYDEVEFYKYN
ncbi:MAG: redoxin domain-containing protein [Flavobacterium sp.]|nr:redoxin domain-containing protein [Flavobacterium sp.]